MKHIWKCGHCDKYTMKELCDCGNKTEPSMRLKYSLDDKYKAYKRKAKLHDYAGRGMI